MIIGDKGLLSSRSYNSYETSDFNRDSLNPLLKGVIKMLESKSIVVFEASEASYEDKYPRLYIAIKEVDKILDNVLEIEDFDIQVFRNEKNYSAAVIIIERYFLKIEYTEEEFKRTQDKLINNLYKWCENIKI